MFGREGDYLFVNSAHGISVDRVEEIFPNAEANGSVRLRDILEAIKLDGEAIQNDGLLFGHVAIRQELESQGLLLKGSPYTKRYANNLIKKADCIRGLMGKDGNSIPYCDCSSLTSFVEEKYTDGQNAHRVSLEKARKMKRIQD